MGLSTTWWAAVYYSVYTKRQEPADPAATGGIRILFLMGWVCQPTHTVPHELRMTIHLVGDSALGVSLEVTKIAFLSTGQPIDRCRSCSA